MRRAESRVWAGLVLAVGSDSSQTRVRSNWVVIGRQVHRLKFVACSDKQGLEYPGKKKKKKVLLGVVLFSLAFFFYFLEVSTYLR